MVNMVVVEGTLVGSLLPLLDQLRDEDAEES